MKVRENSFQGWLVKLETFQSDHRLNQLTIQLKDGVQLTFDVLREVWPQVLAIKDECVGAHVPRVLLGAQQIGADYQHSAWEVHFIRVVTW